MAMVYVGSLRFCGAGRRGADLVTADAALPPLTIPKSVGFDGRKPILIALAADGRFLEPLAVLGGLSIQVLFDLVLARLAFPIPASRQSACRHNTLALAAGRAARCFWNVCSRDWQPSLLAHIPTSPSAFAADAACAGSIAKASVLGRLLSAARALRPPILRSPTWVWPQNKPASVTGSNWDGDFLDHAMDNLLCHGSTLHNQQELA